MVARPITEDDVISHSRCLRQSYLRLANSQSGPQQPYAVLVSENLKVAEQTFTRVKQDCLPFTADQLTGKAEFITGVRLEADNFMVNRVFLQRLEKKSSLGNYSYQPVI